MTENKDLNNVSAAVIDALRAGRNTNRAAYKAARSEAFRAGYDKFLKEALDSSNKHEAKKQRATALSIRRSNKFASEANFANAVFNAPVSFQDAEFISKAEFTNTVFKDLVI